MSKLSSINQIIKHFALAGLVLFIAACDTGMNEQKTLEKARTYLNDGNPRAAVIELRNTLKQNRNNAEARYLFGTLSYNMGSFSNAEKELRRAEKAGWNQQETRLALAQVLATTKQFDRLLEEINDNETWPKKTRANILAFRAIADAGLNNIQPANLSLDKARTLKQDALHVLIITAKFQLSNLRDGTASDTLKQARSLYPDNSEILLLQAVQNIKSKQLAQAGDKFIEVINRDPDKIISANGRRARIGLARIQLMANKYDAADATLKPLLQRSSNDPEVNYLVALLAFSQKNYRRAEDHLREILTVAPKHHQTQQLMGKVKYTLQDFVQSTQYLTDYLDAIPDDVAVRQLLTQTYIILGKPEQARQTIQKNLVLNPNDPAALALLSQIEFNQGNIEVGIQVLKRAIDINPNNAALRKQMVKAYITQNATELALEELKSLQSLSNNKNETRQLAIAVYMNAGQLDKAISIAQAMLKENPDNADVITLNATLQNNNDDAKQARILFNQALKIKPEHPTAIASLASIETNAGNYDKAVTLYKRLVDTNQGGTMPMLALSKIAANQDRTNDMLTWLEKARATAANEANARIILASYYLQNSQISKANIYIQEALKISPGQTDVLALQGKMLLAEKRYSEALPPLKRLVSKLPDSTDAHILIGETFLRLGMIGNARNHLEAILNKQNDHAFATILLIEVELMAGNFDKGLSHARQLQTLQPDHYIGYMQEGDIWMTQQKYKDAAIAFDKAWQRQQTAELAKKQYAALKPTTSFDEAIKPVYMWRDAHPEDASIHFFLAVLYQTMNQNDKAIKEYESTIKYMPKNSVALNNLAWLYSLQGNPEAVDLAERAFRSSPEDPGIQDTYGWILVQQDQVDKGLRLIKQALYVVPDNMEIRFHYATALIRSGQKEQGKQVLIKLLNEDKSFESKEQAIALLQSVS